MKYKRRPTYVAPRAAGVQVFTPEEFYAGKLNAKRSARRFLAAFMRDIWAFVRMMSKPAIVAKTIPIIEGYFRLVLLNETADSR